jgi:hypothetical protein
MCSEGRHVSSQHPGAEAAGCAAADAPLEDQLHLIDGGLLLCLGHEENAFLAAEAGQIPLGEVVLAFALLEAEQRDPLLAGEAFDGLHKGMRELPHQGRRGHRMATMCPEEHHHPEIPLQLRHVEVKVHAVDGLHLQHNALAQDLGYTAGGAHRRLQSPGRSMRPLPLVGLNTRARCFARKIPRLEPLRRRASLPRHPSRSWRLRGKMLFDEPTRLPQRACLRSAKPRRSEAEPP